MSWFECEPCNINITWLSYKLSINENVFIFLFCVLSGLPVLFEEQKRKLYCGNKPLYNSVCVVFIENCLKKCSNPVQTLNLHLPSHTFKNILAI